MSDFLDVVDWSRAQFALTAIYHWLFVPLTLGLSFLLAFMETRYVKTGDVEWKRIEQFWMKLFGVNFAIGVATGLILEFEFGTNWSNYSYFVGDIFGAPLAIEGIFAFFMESTFIAIMFFGWNKVSRRAHLVATWLTAIGASLSALWILVANAWMQSPVGMEFNPVTARNEMVDFWAIVFSPVAINKFLHTISSAFVLGSVFVVGVSGWFLLKRRELTLAVRSIRMAAIFGLISSVAVVWTGDSSAVQVARIQPMKLAAMENLRVGGTYVPLTVVPGVEIPSLLSIMSYRDREAYVAGIEDLVNGNAEYDVMGAAEKMERGRVAIDVFARYKGAQRAGDTQLAGELAALFRDKEFKEHYFAYFGYGYLDSPSDIVPSVGLVYWSFRIMVGLGLWMMLIFAVAIWVTRAGRDHIARMWQWAFLWTIPLAYIASQAGWIVAEVGRQPWTIQDLLPTVAAVSRLDSGSVQVTFWLFAVLFTVLLIAEITILTKVIRNQDVTKCDK